MWTAQQASQLLFMCLKVAQSRGGRRSRGGRSSGQTFSHPMGRQLPTGCRPCTRGPWEVARPQENGLQQGADVILGLRDLTVAKKSRAVFGLWEARAPWVTPRTDLRGPNQATCVFYKRRRRDVTSGASGQFSGWWPNPHEAHAAAPTPHGARAPLDATLSRVHCGQTPPPPRPPTS